MNFRPHIVHSHDWHTAFAPLWLRSNYKDDPVFAAHEVGDDHPQHRLPGRSSAQPTSPISISAPTPIYCTRTTSRPGSINALKHGILHADAVTTVSPTYAREITTPRYGMGMEQALAARGSAVRGILNGVDYEEWDPRSDKLPADPLRPGRPRAQGRAQAQFPAAPGHEADAGRVPLFGIVSRLAPQKGFDLLTDTLPELLQNHDVRLAVRRHRRCAVREILRAASPNDTAAAHGSSAATTRRWRTGSKAPATSS